VNIRYVALGTIDGALIALGVVIATGGYAASSLTLAASMAGALSSSLSNAFGAYVAESAMAGQELSEYARHMMVPNLNGTAIARTYRLRIYAYSGTMGLFALLGAAVPILPIVVMGSNVYAKIASVAFSLMALFSLGAYVGSISKTISKTGLLLMGVRTIALGMLVAFLAYGIGHVLVPS